MREKLNLHVCLSYRVCIYVKELLEWIIELHHATSLSLIFLICYVWFFLPDVNQSIFDIIGKSVKVTNDRWGLMNVWDNRMDLWEKKSKFLRRLAWRSRKFHERPWNPTLRLDQVVFLRHSSNVIDTINCFKYFFLIYSRFILRDSIKYILHYNIVIIMNQIFKFKFIKNFFYFKNYYNSTISSINAYYLILR